VSKNGAMQQKVIDNPRFINIVDFISNGALHKLDSFAKEIIHDGTKTNAQTNG
jgi:hypothetical protein